MEVKVAQAMRVMHPYLAFVSYRFHVEKCREIGIRIDDFYSLKFHKEPYVMKHVYAQYFHPDTLLERIRDVHFYRKPRTLFKGFRVPSWATAEKQHGWEIDAYSKDAWDNAMNDFNSEWTPNHFFGERLEPNILEWFRLEQFGKGFSSRLFFNEDPKLTWIRHNGHLDNKQQVLYSFTHADQDQNINIGIDTTTEEGRAEFKAMYMELAEIAPEIIKKEDFAYPHEILPRVCREAHYSRVWGLYRDHLLITQIDAAVTGEAVSAEDAESAKKFLSAGSKRGINVHDFVNVKIGRRPDLKDDASFMATDRVMTAINMNLREINKKTSRPLEQQFWNNFEGINKVNEAAMLEALPQFVPELSNQQVARAISSGQTSLA